jgi:hypothetical protein
MEKGGRRVELFLPFESLGITVEAVELRPVLLDDQLRWQEGHFKTPLALLADICGLPETAVRQLRFPDADRVMREFMFHLPDLVSDDITNGRNPADVRPQPEQPAPEPHDDVAPAERPSDYIPGIDDEGGFDIADGEG